MTIIRSLLHPNSNKNLILISVIKKKPHALTVFSKNAEELVPFQIFPDRSNERCQRFGRELKKFYFGLTEPSMATVNAYMAVSFKIATIERLRVRQ